MVSENKTDERFWSWVILAFTIPALALASSVDWILAGLIPGWLYLAYGLAWLLAAWLAAGRRPSRRNGLLLLAFAAILFALYITPAQRELFLNDFHRIKPGMSRTEVDAIMQSYSANTLAPRTDHVVYRHASAGSGSADHGVVRFQENRVTSVSFLAD